MSHTLGRVIASCLIAVGLSSCAITEKKPQFTGWFSILNGCDQDYAEIDAKIMDAGVGNASYHRLPGYPFFRIDRTIASFADELDSPERFGGFSRRMRSLEREAREFEYMNLGFTLRQRGEKRHRLTTCGQGLGEFAMADPKELKRVLKESQPPSLYSRWERTIGFFGLRASSIKSRVMEAQESVRQDYARPLESIETRGAMQLWVVKPQLDPDNIKTGFRKTVTDELDFPGMTETMWRTLAQVNAPQFWIDTRGEQDLIGAPKMTRDGPTVDTSEPKINIHITFTRFGTHPLAQVNYFVWFPGDNDQGAMDGLIWRVTFDTEINPIMYESMHMSGKDHYMFPVAQLEERPLPDNYGEPRLFPQNGLAPPRRPTLRISSGSHRVLRVVDPEVVDASNVREFELVRYEDLYSLETPEGNRQSLFTPEGIVRGSQGSTHDPLWVAATGIQNRDALRQYGHHAISYAGQIHFDDPDLLETLFVAPDYRPPTDWQVEKLNAAKKR